MPILPVEQETDRPSESDLIKTTVHLPVEIAPRNFGPFSDDQSIGNGRQLQARAEVDPMEYDLKIANELSMQDRQKPQHFANEKNVNDRKLYSADDHGHSEELGEGGTFHSVLVFLGYCLLLILFLALLTGLSVFFKKGRKTKKSKKKSKKTKKGDREYDDLEASSSKAHTEEKDFATSFETTKSCCQGKEGNSSFFIPLPDDDEQRGERYRQRRKERRAERRRRRQLRKKHRRKAKKESHRRHQSDHNSEDSSDDEQVPGEKVEKVLTRFASPPPPVYYVFKSTLVDMERQKEDTNLQPQKQQLAKEIERTPESKVSCKVLVSSASEEDSPSASPEVSSTVLYKVKSLLSPPLKCNVTSKSGHRRSIAAPKSVLDAMARQTLLNPFSQSGAKSILRDNTSPSPNSSLSTDNGKSTRSLKRVSFSRKMQVRYIKSK